MIYKTTESRTWENWIGNNPTDPWNKSRLLKQIDIIKQAIYVELSYRIRKDEIKINKTNEEISQVLDNIKTNENEIEFLKDNGSDNQLFTSLHKQVANIKSIEASVLQMI